MRAVKRQHSNFFYDRNNKQEDKTHLADFVFEEFQNNKKGGIQPNGRRINIMTSKDIDDERPLNNADSEDAALEKLSQFSIIRLLGSGSYAQVKLAQHKMSKQRVAIKIYSKSKLNDVAKNSAV